MDDAKSEKIALEEAQNDIRARLGSLRYLDHAGAALYSSFQVNEASDLLKSTWFGNGQSGGVPAENTVTAVENARLKILKMFGASHSTHWVVFTSGATAGFKLLADTLPWCTSSEVVLAEDCHQSMLSLRDSARHRGAATSVFTPSSLSSLLSGKPQPRVNESFLLFGYPAECSFSGDQYRLDLTSRFRSISGRNVVTVVDSARLAAHESIDLSQFPDVDILVVSLPKIFGLPTGLGAVVVRKGSFAEELLKDSKKYYGGGTVDAYDAQSGILAPRLRLDKRLEDGTLNIHAIVSLEAGFNQLARIGGIEAVGKLVHELACEAARRLKALKHGNGTALVEVLGHAERAIDVLHECPKMSIVCFILQDAEGRPIGHKVVERFAALEGIVLRTGCMCSPGACHRMLGLNGSDIASHYKQGHVCGDDKDIIDGKRTGAIRASFGLGSSIEDVDALVSLLEDYFIMAEGNGVAASDDLVATAMTVARVVVYPVKGVGGMDVSKWRIGSEGLLHDRRFSIVDVAEARAVGLKRNGRLALVSAQISEEGSDLSLRVSEELAEECGISTEVKVVLDKHAGQERREIRVCGRQEEVQDIGDLSSWRWLSTILKSDVRLVEACKPMLNKESLLVVPRGRVERLNSSLQAQGTDRVHEDVFRGNIYADTEPSEAVDLKGSYQSSSLRIEDVASCVRCGAVNVDSKTGTARQDSEPLRTLTREGNGMKDGAILGELFNVVAPAETYVQVGDVLKQAN